MSIERAATAVFGRHVRSVVAHARLRLKAMQRHDGLGEASYGIPPAVDIAPGLCYIHGHTRSELHGARWRPTDRTRPGIEIWRRWRLCHGPDPPTRSRTSASHQAAVLLARQVPCGNVAAPWRNIAWRRSTV
jgi:hypothetical protein